MHADVKLCVVLFMCWMPALLLLVVPPVQARMHRNVYSLHDKGSKFTNKALEEAGVNEKQFVDKYPARSIAAIALCGDFTQKQHLGDFLAQLKVIWCCAVHLGSGDLRSDWQRILYDYNHFVRGAILAEILWSEIGELMTAGLRFGSSTGQRFRVTGTILKTLGGTLHAMGLVWYMQLMMF